MPHHVVFALLTPWGRISQFPFAGLAMGLFIAGYILWSMVAARAATDPFGIATFFLVAVFWMMFCVFTRRFRDLGSSGAWMLVVLVIALAALLVKLDPRLLGADPTDLGQLQFLALHGQRLVESLVVATFCYLVRANGMTGPNAYGPEFGDDWENYGRPLEDDGPLAGATGGVRFASNLEVGRHRKASGGSERASGGAASQPYALRDRRKANGQAAGGVERRRDRPGFGRR